MVLLIRYRWVLSIFFLLLATSGIPYIKKALEPNNELSIWFVKDDPALKSYKDFSDTYGNDRIVVLMLHCADGIFQPEVLKQIQMLTTQLPHIQGVKQVNSLINFRDLYRIRINDTLRIKYQSPFLSGIPSSHDSLLQLGNQVLSSELFTDLIINGTGNTTLIYVELDPFEKVDHLRGEIIEEIEFIARKILKTEEVVLGGLDVITYGFNKLSKHDFFLFMSINYFLMFTSIYFLFRKWSFVFLVLSTVSVSLMLMLALYGYAGKQLNIFSLVIPSLVVIIGLINVLHIINQFEASSSINSNKGRIKNVTVCLKKVFKPCLFTTITTMIGFLALLSSSTVVLRDFGLFSAIGILFVFIISFVTSATVLPMIKTVKSSNHITNQISDKLIRLSKILLGNSKLYTALFMITLPVIVVGICRVRSDMYILGYMPESSEVIRDHHEILHYWGDYFPMDFLIETKDNYSFKNPLILKALGNFQKEVEEIPEIRSSLSIYNLMDRGTQVILHKDLETLITDPTTNQYSLRRILNRRELDLSRYISEDLRTARITLTGPIMSVSELEKKIDMIQEVFVKHFGETAHLSETSYPALFLEIMNYAMDSMINSLAWAILLIFVALLVLLRDLKMALIAMIPNLYPLLIMFAIMGFTGINLDLATCTVACIALGVAVDDTIHLLYHFQYHTRFEQNNVPMALLKSHSHVGRIVVISSIILCGGYLVLMMASVKTVIYFGFLSTVVVIGALIGDIFLLPILLFKVYNKNGSSMKYKFHRN